MLAWDQSQPGRTASGGELSRDLHGHGIDLIHFAVGVGHSRRDREIEPSLCPIPDGLLNTACTVRVSRDAAVVEDLAYNVRRARRTDKCHKQVDSPIVGDQNQMMG